MSPRTRDTARFYDDLTRGKISRGLWGLDSRFDPSKIIESPSVDRHFRRVVDRYVTKRDRVMDLGCGPGGFTAILAELAGEAVGVDVSEEWVALAQRTFEERQLPARAMNASGSSLPFDTGHFDVVTLIDVIHHLDEPAAVLAEVRRVLRPGGTLLIFEPNKLNPLLTLLCVFDRNEWGFLRPAMGRFRGYVRLVTPGFDVDEQAYSGLLIGPDGANARRIADYCSEGTGASLLGWLSPKLFVRATRSP